jgi:hypothetical protein
MFTVNFVDGTNFIGGIDLNDTKWKDIPNKRIKNIEYSLFSKQEILENYESYNHLVSKIKYNDKIINRNVILMGKIKDKVECIDFDLTYKKITRYKRDYGKEYTNASTIGWKEGITNE